MVSTFAASIISGCWWRTSTRLPAQLEQLGATCFAKRRKAKQGFYETKFHSARQGRRHHRPSVGGCRTLKPDTRACRERPKDAGKDLAIEHFQAKGASVCPEDTAAF